MSNTLVSSMNRLVLAALITLAGVFGFCAGANAAPPMTGVSVADYSSIQEAIDKNPGKTITVPTGDYPISDAIKITTNGTRVCGSGRIIQSNPKAAIFTVDGATDVQIHDLTLTRSEGQMDCFASAIIATKSVRLVLSNLSIPDNRSQPAVIEIDKCRDVRVLNCSIVNYMTIAIDDRTRTNDYGFAFHVIDGTGINVRDTGAILIQGDSVVENRLLPTPEIKAQYHLGEFCKRNPTKGVLTTQKMWDEGYYNAWHQGTAICIATPMTNDYVQILGNYVENAAQGLDIHADHVIVSQNIVNNAFIGMKAMHGSRNVIITNNQFSRNDLWAIGLMPGAGSHPAAFKANPNSKPLQPNVDGGSIIANNIISDFGYGTARWMWKDFTDFAPTPFKFTSGQKDFNPPLTDVIVQGNIVYDTGRDGVLEDGKAVVEPPRYTYAVFISPDKPDGPPAPKNLHFSNNILHPGTLGISNLPMNP